MRSKIILFLALGLGLFFRTYDYVSRFTYSHDSDLASWIIKDIVVDRHQRLIGQLTSSPGIFIGSLFYYLQSPFYWLSGMDPIGIIGLVIIIGLFSIWSMWYVAGPLAAIIYAGSWLIAGTEREIVPTTPVFLWSIWFYQTFVKLWRGEKRWLYVAAILVSLIWHFNLALILGVPLLIIAFFRNFKKYSLKDVALPVLLCLILNLPLIVFEIRHGGSQTKALYTTLTAVGEEKALKVNKTVTYILRNANRVFYDDSVKLPQWLIPGIILVGILAFSPWRWLVLGWVGLYLAFFSVHPLPLSEYYLNGITIVWVLGAALLLQKLPKSISAIILMLFLFQNFNRLYSFEPNHTGYLEKKALINFIKEDANQHNYPCVAVSYITSRGNDLGYRYWFWLANLKVMRPDTLAPVYTIVFPHSLVERMDKTFGSLGLIYPDYPRYTVDGIAKSCDRPDQNLTESMFGFTK